VRRWWAVGLAVVALGAGGWYALGRPAPAGGTGAVVGLGTLGGNESEAVAVNDRGQVVGRSTTAVPGQSHAFLWESGRMTDLGTLGGTDSRAVAINDAGQVIGTSTTAAGAYHAFLWQHGVMTDLGTLPGQRDSGARALNNRGQVIGDSGPRAFLWQDGRLTDLGLLPGGTQAQVTGINDRGQVVGVADTRDSEERAFLWQDGRMSELDALGDNDLESHAFAVNDRGQVIGDAEGDPVVWQGGSRTPVPGLGGPCCELAGLNASGEVAGTGATRSGYRHAFLWNGTAVDLGRSAGGLSTVAVALDDAGDVIGYQTTKAGDMRDARPVYWHRGSLIRLGTVPGTIRGAPLGMNNQGRAVGYCFTGPDREQAVLWQLPA
jgi:probable HAF family extracellular repeat protein